MKIGKLLLTATVLVLLFVSCGNTPEDPCIACTDIIVDNQYPMESVKMGIENVEYAIYRNYYDFESVDNFSVTRIESLKDLKNFQKKHEVHSGGTELLTIESFNQYAATLDEEFFKEKVLVTVMLTTGSGSERFYVSSVYKKGDVLEIGISSVMVEPFAAFTCDMASWCVAVVFDRSDIDGVCEIKAGSDVKHYQYEAKIEGSDYWSPVLSIDENAGRYILSYGEYHKNNHHGYYSIDKNGITLFLVEDKSEWLYFKKSENAYVFKEKKSNYSDMYIPELTFPDSTEFTLHGRTY